MSPISADTLARLWPEAPARLRAAIVEQMPDVCARRQITTRRRLVHFLAQISHESGGGTVVRESMRYKAPRILQIFGAGHHSAAIEPPEARRLAADAQRTGGEALAERVYGLGNPHMAHDLGNTAPGDGWKFRGGGLTQTTGRAAYALAAKRSGLPLLEQPDLIAEPAHALDIAGADFGDCRRDGKTCLEWADEGDIVMVTRALNGGTNGLADRRAWYARWDRALPEVLAGPSPVASPSAPESVEATIEFGDDGWQVQAIQRRLADLGYPVGRIDGRFGDATRAAVLDFQAREGLATDGSVGPVTKARLDAASPREVSAARAAATAADIADHPAVQAATATGATAKKAGFAALIAAGADAVGDPGASIDKGQEVVAKVQAAKGLWGSVSDLAAPAAGWIVAHPGAVVALVVVVLAAAIITKSDATVAALVARHRTGQDMG